MTEKLYENIEAYRRWTRGPLAVRERIQEENENEKNDCDYAEYDFYGECIDWVPGRG